MNIGICNKKYLRLAYSIFQKWNLAPPKYQWHCSPVLCISTTKVIEGISMYAATMLPPGSYWPYVVAESVENSYQRILYKVSWMRQPQVLEHRWAWFLWVPIIVTPLEKKKLSLDSDESDSYYGQGSRWEELSCLWRLEPVPLGSRALVMEGF